MKKIFFIIVFSIFFVGCTPLVKAIEKVIGPTPTETPAPTLTPYPTYTLRPTYTAYPTYTPYPKDPNILFSDDFASNKSGWWENGDYMGKLFFENGTYHISGRNSDYVNWSIMEKKFTNAVLSIEVQRISGTDDDAITCLFWRISSDGNNYYALCIYGNGDYWITKQVSGKSTYLSGLKTSKNWNKDGQSNIVTIAFNEENADIFFNNNFVLNFQDSSRESGDIALGAYSLSGNSYEFIYDNLNIYKYDPANPYTPSVPDALSTKAPNSQSTAQYTGPTTQPTLSNPDLDITIKVINLCSERHLVIFSGPVRLKYDVAPGATVEWQGAKGNYSWTVDGIPGEQSPMDLWESVWTLTLCINEAES